MKLPVVYIMANKKNGTLYVGVTSNIQRRVYEHKEGAIDGFTKRYNCKTLVFYEAHGTMESAILRERKIKCGARKKKIDLIESINFNWEDLYNDLLT